MPDHYKPGNVEEAHRAVHLCRAAWEESEGAIARVDSDTAQLTPVYGGHLTGTGTGDPRWQGHEALKKTANLPEHRATRAAFPSKFQPPLPTSHPANLFLSTPTALHQSSQTVRFVNRNDRETALVYTNGACVNNGQTNPRDGWAVVLGPADGGKGRNGRGVKNRDLWELLLEEVERWDARGGMLSFGGSQGCQTATPTGLQKRLPTSQP